MKPYEEENKFLHDYDSDAFKIIASYEEAANIDYKECYARWYGDLALFEGTTREGITYEKLCARYKAGLKYLGIIHDQAKAVCSHFLSNQLADHIRTELKKSDADAGYVPRSILTEMDLPELTREMLSVDHDMDVDCDIGQEITCCFETWFDVDKKFGTHIHDEDGAWLNMYGKYNPFEDTLRIECEISRDKSSEYFDYEPTASESQLIKGMIAEKIMETHGQTPEEFCDDFYGYKPEFGGLT